MIATQITNKVHWEICEQAKKFYFAPKPNFELPPQENFTGFFYGKLGFSFFFIHKGRGGAS